ncbi:hypothetical protein ACFV6E_19025 [Streptomyces sp. NPDC059785]|uniref:SGM_3592 family protein n=1 Tax=unclassified Streptomyces TaxID=2593676 RepID=UPI0036522D91
MAVEEPRGDYGHGDGGHGGHGGDGHDGERAGDGWDGVVLDEDFIRSARAKEPSGRARMLAARWRDGGPEPQPWRSDEPPAGWFFSRSRRRRRRRQ